MSADATRGESGVNANATQSGIVSAVKDHVEKSGGSTVFLFQLSRLVVVLTLLGLEISSFVQEDEQPHASISKKWGKKHKGKHHRQGGGDALTKREWIDLTLCLTYVRPNLF